MNKTKTLVEVNIKQRDMSFFRSSRFHMYMGIFWGIMLIPTVLWLGQMVMYVSLISVWALISTEWGAYQASRAEETQASTDVSLDTFTLTKDEIDGTVESERE